MMSKIEISKNSDTVLKTGRYVFTFEALVFPSQIADIMKNLSGLMEITSEVLENKKIKIIQIERIGKTNLIAFTIDLLENPVPVGVIVAVILALLGGFGLLLTLQKVENIVESPAGLGIGVFLLIGAGVLAFTFIKREGII